MAADDFEIKPTWVEVHCPEFHNIITQSESMKKDYQNLSTTSVQKFTLKFLGLSDANAELILEHYNGRYGGYDSFAWKNSYIPAYIIDLLDLSTNDLTGRWVDGSLKLTAHANYYDVEIDFEKAN